MNNPNNATVPPGTECRRLPTGARKISMEMLEARQRADAFVGCQPGTAKPLTYLAAFQEAEPYLGLPTLAFKLIAWLVKQTMAFDWEAGSRPVAWPSAQRQGEFLGLSPTRVKMLNRMLFEAGIFVIRDNPQGKRYGRRGPDKRIIEAYGFDLSPLAQRYQEFVQIAAEARAERRRIKEARQRITIARRSVRQLTDLMPLPLSREWTALAVETGELVAAARRAHGSQALLGFADLLEGCLMQVEALAKSLSKAVNLDPVGSVRGPHTTSTNLSSNPLDTVIAAEEGSRVVREVPKPAPAVAGHRSHRDTAPAGIKRPSQLLDLMPRLAAYVIEPEPDWSSITAAAYDGLRHELGVSSSLWAEACRVMGRIGATVALGIVSTKPSGHFVRGAGGYFGGMVRKAEKGELFLEKTLWGLRQMKSGRLGSHAVN